MKEDIRSRYIKYVFLPGKINSVIVSLVLLGLFTDQNDVFPCHFIYFSWRNRYPFLYLKPTKSYPFRAEPPHIGHYVELKRAISDLRNEHTYLMHAHPSLYTGKGYCHCWVLGTFWKLILSKKNQCVLVSWMSYGRSSRYHSLKQKQGLLYSFNPHGTMACSSWLSWIYKL